MGKQGKVKPKSDISNRMKESGVTQELYDSLNKFSNPKNVYNELRKIIKGQDEALKKLALVSAQRDASLLMEVEGGVTSTGRTKHSSLMISGNTGCGKTFMVRTLAEMLKAPIVSLDLSEYTGAGWKGKDIENALNHLADVATSNGFASLRTIVFVDEIDKVLRDASPHGDHKGEVLNELLVSLDRYENDRLPHTILWVFSGSFSLYRDKKTKLSQKGSIGFGSKMKETGGDITYKMNRDDYISAGMSPEFIGRITHTITLNPVGKKELREILDSEDNSPLIDLFDLAHYMGINLELDEDRRTKIVDEAVKLGNGVRGLRTAAELILFDGVM